MRIASIENILEKARSQKKRIAVAFGEDSHSLEAVSIGIKEGLFTAVNFARRSVLEETAKTHSIDISLLEIIEVSGELEGIEKAVKEVREGRANVLMKGICSSANYLRGVLNKEWGLLPEGRLLSNAAIIEVETYHKLLMISDPGVLLRPTLEEKAKQIEYCVEVAHALGVDNPKVAVVAAVETINTKMQATADAAILTQMNKRGQIKGCIVDGPLALDLAVSKEAAEIKKVISEVAGDADILIFPDIETGNSFYKSLTKLANAKTAAILLGTTKPCVIPSRGDSVETKLSSLALASIIS